MCTEKGNHRFSELSISIVEGLSTAISIIDGDATLLK